ncbi:energy-coupling factor transport system ATP-binding protein [Alteribacillus persepolensis]|uniref:Energy-coupling factor transport system ATP-binding protein n=1 Tax=Alteribacillus persepolensis TaxID=568899 RepID=A0A1G8HMF1_9BACI|nr:energy-coupling factor transporter ATPase [Alteribacillus persepolensis]SDI07620.1 energy-coupling factor transport system ATP-binding protein [Alteribacillus persepolensis]
MLAAQFNEVWFQYEPSGPWILKNIRSSVEKGEWITILGPNGSGKSTLSRLCNGLFIPTKGDVLIEELSTKEQQNIAEVRKRAGMVFQNPDHQFVAPTVRDDIAFGMENIGVPREEMVARIEAVARQVGIQTLLDVEPHRLSGGQKQRVAIAGILALQPNMMILDEVTSMLDPKGKREVMATIEQLHRKNGVTVISVTHHLQEALLSDRIWYMEAGEIALDIPTSEIMNYVDWFSDKGIPLPYAISLWQELRDNDDVIPTLNCFIRENMTYEDHV